jgi:hypothetical protein
MDTMSTKPATKPAPHKRTRAPSKTSQGLTALSPNGLYRISQFIPSFLGIGKSTWHAGVRSGLFPAPEVKRGRRMTMWSGKQILDAAAQLGRSTT